MKLFNKYALIFTLLPAICIISACKKFLQIDPPSSSIEQRLVFSNNAQATSAVTGLYSSLSSAGFASGNTGSVSFYAGISSDDFIGYNTYLPFYENQLYAELPEISRLYLDFYKTIYRTNSIIEGLNSSQGVSQSIKSQLMGEVYFMRAFSHFYLVNLFGPVPLALTTNYRVTEALPRSSIENVYTQILSDLKIAESLLSDAYPSSGRTRVNKSVVQAMLARVYLYKKDWVNAQSYSSLVINKTKDFNLVTYDGIFLADSREAILQFVPPAGNNAPDAAILIPELGAAPLRVSLRQELVNAFEPGDKRFSSWVKDYTLVGITYHYPFKYKVKSSSLTSEYSTVFRLSEQYLIRAEANINLQQITAGISDLNTVRLRTISGINTNVIPALSDNLTQQDALLAVEKERRVELFSEWGHRWLDLKRTNRAAAVLSNLKPLWNDTDQLYPIPVDELNRNKNIRQNDGY